ncbi:Zn-dependent protease with chaperone function [Selenomonas sp. GACV-9]|uniref:M48 family metalloprotease n=1 Tax=Selenomonas sp. GACV-9 TaxID=3158782 RepID=UPI0008EAEE25|nr:Zn-dependent protease with chaperone function [Selenomonas ruminantium]
MRYTKRWKRGLTAMVLSGFMITGTVLAHLPKAEAADAWAVAAQALGVLGAYQSSLSSILALGNNAKAQIESQRQDIQQNGVDPNDNDVQVVNQVMQQLVSKGDYVLKENSLPFCWTVNNSKDFNAACYPTNYVSVNKALVRGLNLEPDELAAVLAHEMTHGIEQHSAHNYAKAVAQYYGMAFLNMDTGVADWNKLNALANYSIAKNVTLPTEYDADAGGFNIMTSAGFNPGGGAAAMARMARYLTYETQNVLEYQDPDPKLKEQENYNDHPDTDKREQKLAQMMTDYGCGHVTVKDRKDVYIDGQELLSVDWDGDYDNTLENAYFVAGAIAKAFHDNDSPAGWNFRTDGDGNVTCLTDTRINQALHRFLSTERAGARLQELVTAAYASEAASGARAKMKAAEQARQQQLAEQREAVLGAKAKAVKKMRENGDTYSDYGQADKALFQMERVFAARNPENEAENYAIRGRAKAISGDFTAALQDSDKSVAMDGKNVYNYLNRADVYHMMGNTEAALADLAKAKDADKGNPYGWLMSAQIYEELGQRAEALANYQEFYRLRPKAFRVIPAGYLQDVSAKDYKTLQKEKEDARKKYEQQWNKEHKDKKAADKKSAATS